jgi:hypothetical protein
VAAFEGKAMKTEETVMFGFIEQRIFIREISKNFIGSMRNFRRFFNGERAQVSIEFILLAGGVVVAAIIFWSLGGSIRALGTTTSQWVAQERNLTITRITR